MSPGGAIVNNLKDAMAEIGGIFESAQREIVFVVPPSVFSIASTSYNTVHNAKRFIQNGGVMRGLTTISPANAEEMQMRLGIGEDLRHSDLHYEIFMIVGDRQQSLSAINVGMEEYTFDAPLIAFRSEASTYAEYLIDGFEKAWSEAVPAKERIRELLEQAPP